MLIPLRVLVFVWNVPILLRKSKSCIFIEIWLSFAHYFTQTQPNLAFFCTFGAGYKCFSAFSVTDSRDIFKDDLVEVENELTTKVICKICIIPNTSCRKFSDNCFLKGSISPLPLMFPPIAIEHMFHFGTHDYGLIPSNSTDLNYLILNEINWSQFVTGSFGNVIANCDDIVSNTL